MKKWIAFMLSAILALSLGQVSFAAQEEVTGEVLIYSSMYPFVLEMLDEAIRAEFPNLKPGNGDSFFLYGGSGALIIRLEEERKSGVLGCDMMLVAEPSLSLELKEAEYLYPVAIPGAETLLRFPCDDEGYWYPVRVCNMVLAYNPELEADWAAKGVAIPRTFQDFAADRSLAGRISMGDPLTSGTTFAAVASLTQISHYGRQFLRNLAANKVTVESGSSAIARLKSGECAVAMILEESVLKALKDAEDAGEPLTSLACIYPEDGVILIPSTVMTVAEEHSPHRNPEACAAVEKWLLTEEAQQLILKGFMHSVFRNTDQIPEGSVDTNWLISRDLGVDWENVSRHREEINLAWQEIVIWGKRVGR